jgi:small subunit ribosomal protein S23
MATQTLAPKIQFGKVRAQSSLQTRRQQSLPPPTMGFRKSVYSPSSVAKTVNQMMGVGLLKNEPVWYQPVLNTPPMTDFARRPAQTHQVRSWNRPNDLREIQSLHRGLESHLRTKFYKEHPWELARPRIVVEEDGADYVRQDWSKMQQYGKPLDGERYNLFMVKC